MQPSIHLKAGDRIGEWAILEEVPSPDDRPRVRCRCSCGQEGVFAVETLRSGASLRCTSCAPARDPYAPRRKQAAPSPLPTPAAVPPPPRKPKMVTPRRTTIPVPSVKVTLPLRPEQLPRDVLPPDGAASVPIEVVIEVAAGDGRRPLSIRATFSSKNYRRAVKAIDEHGGNATVLIQGRLTGNGELLDAGIAVQPKASASSPQSAGRGSTIGA